MTPQFRLEGDAYEATNHISFSLMSVNLSSRFGVSTEAALTRKEAQDGE
jgi:hypothetical protein